MVIDSFTGKFFFLSNFYVCSVEYDGIIYPSTEHAFQAQKTLDNEMRRAMTAQATPANAKKMGRILRLRPDWEQVKDKLMGEIVRAKFDQHVYLQNQLVQTKDATLVESNWWGDTYWGVCKGVGQNKLGKILMEVRADLANRK